MVAAISFLLLLFLFRKSFSWEKKDKGFGRNQVDEWERTLSPSSFIGKVKSIGKSDNDSRFYSSIYILLQDSVNLNIPNDCNYFRFKKGVLLLDAHHQNINSRPGHEIISGDVIKKNSNNDSLYIYSEWGVLKYFFEIFDGIKKTAYKSQIPFL